MATETSTAVKKILPLNRLGYLVDDMEFEQAEARVCAALSRPVESRSKGPRQTEPQGAPVYV